ncbi:DUF2653 family protein [Paenibacillus turpanensis]|uniref:DUF2653 family protein n=1 Tax=Paenibacillus turpanensis TaxID=2689078 RepID=UPI00140E7F64|nr:DUF2653 family protein [Paenibacillus turpanensis]
MKLNEDEIINAICFHVAERKQIRPEQVEAQLAWDEDHGYSCEVFAEGRSQYYVEANMLEAIERYLLKKYDQRVFRSQIQLDIEEEMVAYIRS